MSALPCAYKTQAHQTQVFPPQPRFFRQVTSILSAIVQLHLRILTEELLQSSLAYTDVQLCHLFLSAILDKEVRQQQRNRRLWPRRSTIMLLILIVARTNSERRLWTSSNLGGYKQEMQLDQYLNVGYAMKGFLIRIFTNVWKEPLLSFVKRVQNMLQMLNSS